MRDKKTIYCIYSKIPFDDEEFISLKHVEGDYLNKLREKRTSRWPLLRKYITIHGPQKVKSQEEYRTVFLSNLAETQQIPM
jgi:MoxR-like ATPase